MVDRDRRLKQLHLGLPPDMSGRLSHGGIKRLEIAVNEGVSIPKIERIIFKAATEVGPNGKIGPFGPGKSAFAELKDAADTVVGERFHISSWRNKKIIYSLRD